ncbi:MAG: S9 family peptidase [Akkermansiaceae bacterium]|nr:S9 family peptidase [Armatimonadota bacterium]
MPRLRLAHFFVFFALITALSCPASAETAKSPAPKPLSIEWIMRGPELYGTEPTDVRWSLDSKQIYFRWKEPGEPRRESLHWYVVDKTASKDAKPRRLSDKEAENVPPVFDGEDPTTYHLGGGMPYFFFERDGDIFRSEPTVRRNVRITNTPAVRESDPHFAGNGSDVVYRVDDNLFRLSGTAGVDFRQLTDIRTGPAPKNESRKTEGTANIAETIERELFDSVRARTEERERERVRQSAREAQRGRTPFYLAETESVRDLVVSPDTKTVLALLDIPAKGATPSGVTPQYVNEDGFVSAPKARPNVGWEKSGTDRCVLLQVSDGKAIPVTVPPALKDRALRFLSAKFSSASGRLAVSARAEDGHDRWLFFVDLGTGVATVADTLHDPAWVNGPGWNAFGWTEDGNHLYCVSEESGWGRVILIGVTGTRQTLTPDRSEAYDISVRAISESETGYGNFATDKPTPVGTLYFTSSEGDLGQRHFYRRSLNGNENINLTRSLPGWNEATLSPDGKSLAVVHSYTNKPPELFVMDARPDAAPRQITVSPSPEFRAHPWRDVPVVKIAARDGTPVYARLFTSTKKTQATGAAVVFVHGAGYLQNVDKAWTEYPREYMFHHFLAERGYTVLDVDYRGSAGYGRDFRTGIYKHMGGKDLSDVTDSVRWLIKNQKVDPKRVGIYGGSYGGFLTLMALFTEPKTYRAGAALRPVTDWTKYNQGYTSRILGLPQDDEAAYRRSSPIFFAEGLTGSLLMCHGMRDDNVFFQDTVRLTERLIELGKTDHFETAIYPVESHSFTEPASWTDEYKRIFALFERTIGGRE